MRAVWIACFALCAVLPAHSLAETEVETWSVHAQSTYVWQSKPAFAVAYSGPNSLSPEREKSYSFTATAGLGFRPWSGGEIYFNPEAAQGVPLSSLTGLGGFTNGEIARTAGPKLKFYRARLFLRQTWDAGGAREPVEADMNQLAGSQDSRRWVLTAGNIAVGDIFDDNSYSHDPRTQFLNWSVMTHGAYDFAADARGYTWGAALEWYRDTWAVRAGRFIQPQEPNQQRLDRRIFRHYGDQIEVERSHAVAELAGKVRLLVFRNRALMSRFEDALDLAAATGGVPDINEVRFADQVKRGAGINVEQAVSKDAGLFLRASWADGRTEAYAFAEIDRSLSAGLSVRGRAWGREDDVLGIAMARNALSSVHSEYLARGGLGFFVGDGRIRYRPEVIVEAFYNLRVAKAISLSLDWQRIRNPAYNADRGTANFGAARLHAEF